MKKLLVLFCLSMIISQTYAQETGPIDVVDGKYYQNDVALRNGIIKNIVADVPDALREVKKGTARNTTGMIFSGLGGAMLGTSLADAVLGTSYYGDNPTTGIIVGVAFIGGGVWLAISGGKKISTGVEIYNSSFASGYHLQDVKLDFGVAPHGIGFTCTF